jgi:D-amino-acid dehydrogenase
VTFLYDTAIAGIMTEGDRVSGVETSRDALTADRYVLALGSHSPLLLRRLGISCRSYPIKGYSLTVPITDTDAAPVSTVMDETYKVATTRLGDRIRIGGTAEIAGYDNALHPSAAARSTDRSVTCFPSPAMPPGDVLVRPAADDA